MSGPTSRPDLDRQIDFWKERIAVAPAAFELLIDHPRPLTSSLLRQRASRRLDAGRWMATTLLAQSSGADPFTVVLAAYELIAFRYTGQEELWIGSVTCTCDPGNGKACTNPVAVRLRIAEDETVKNALALAQASINEAAANRDVPFETVAKLTPTPPLFRTLVVPVGVHSNLCDAGQAPDPQHLGPHAGGCDLVLVVAAAEAGVILDAEYDGELFAPATIERLLGQIETVLANMAARPDTHLRTVPLLNDKERDRVLYEWNATYVKHPYEKCIHELVEVQAANYRDAVAVVDKEHALTYRELNSQANRLAHYLRTLGVGSDARVAICVERSLDMMIGLLAILKAGGAYVPLDPSYPTERLRLIVEDSTPVVVLTHARVQASVQAAIRAALARPVQGVPMIDLKADAGCWESEPPTNPGRVGVGLARHHLAYVIYTSGSTGRPKGVMVERLSLSNYIAWQSSTFAFTRDDTVLQRSSISFDASVWELWIPLAIGARLVLLPTESGKNPAEILQTVQKHQVTIAQFVPSLLRMLIQHPGKDVRLECTYIFSGGEALDAPLAEQARPRARRELVNLYGPTEATIYSTAWRCPESAKLDLIPIGQPIANTQIYILDAHGQPVPIGMAGELYIGGAGVARGYLNRPDLTAERFVADPFTDKCGARMYKTGDLARYRADRSIEYLGRNDFQVKIRGFRIELGEIEACLSEYPAVRQAVVLAREDSPGDKRLVAYYTVTRERDGFTAETGVTESIKAPASAEALRTHLLTVLPKYMVPAAYIALDALPLTPNGKLDRNALPAPDDARPASSTLYVPPSNEAERAIAAIWQDVLHIRKVGVNDNFFDLGGNSVLLAQAHSRLISSFGKKFLLIDLFKYTTVAAQAQYLTLCDNSTVLPKDASRPGSARRRQPAEQADVAVIGMVGRFPGARNLEQFWSNLSEGVQSFTVFSDEQLLAMGVGPELVSDPDYVKRNVAVLEDFDCFDARFFGFSPRDAALTDPQQRLFLEAAWHALEDAGYDPHRYAGRIGVYAGQNPSQYLLGSALHPQRAGMASSLQIRLNNDKDYLATQVAYRLNLKGPALSIQTACSTSLVAVHMACQGLISGECDIALAGGVALNLQGGGYLYVPESILSADGHCRVFDAAARGTVFGSGLGLVALKRLTDALNDGDAIRAVIKGSAINNDGARKIGYTAPSEDGQVEAIREAQAVAGVEPATLGYIEAHGTGTVLGDPIEVGALTRVFRERTEARGFCGLGSVKSNIGHLDTAAGVAGLIKTVLSLERRQLPPSLNVATPNPRIDWTNSPFYINTELRRWQVSEGQRRRAGVSSFGVGGTNAHAILEEAPPLPATDPSRGEELLLLSARTEDALAAATANLGSYLRSHPEVNLADIAYTLKVGRHPFSHRRVLIAHDIADAAAVLEGGDPRRLYTAANAPRRPSLVFAFPGQGAQYVSMGRGLYNTEPAFREALDRCAGLLRPYLKCNLIDVLYPKPEDEASATAKLHQTAFTQPALFAVEYAMVELWQTWGIRPQAMIGHSIGEYVAAHVAGVFSLEDALALVARRGALIQSLPRGSMLSVSLPATEIDSYLNDHVTLSAVNAPRLCVVSGASQAIDALETRLNAEGVDCTRLRTSHAFHSPMIDPVLEEFAAHVAGVTLNAPRIPFVSNVSGTWITAEEARDPRYWARHLRERVRFSEGLAQVWAQENPFLLEVGPGRTLTTFAKQHEVSTAGACSLRHPQDKGTDRAFLLAALGRLWLAGVEIDWRAVHGTERRRRVPLPTYPFARERYWIETPSEGGDVPRALRKSPDISRWFYEPSWKRSTLAHSASPKAGTAQDSPWLVFLDDVGVGAKVVERLRQTGKGVVTVAVGNKFAVLGEGAFAINPGERGDYETLIRELRRYRQFPQTLMHLWNVTAADKASSRLACLDAVQALGFDSLLFLVQALENHRLAIDNSLHLGVVCNHVQEVVGDEWLCPEKATLLGACRVIALEYDNITCSCIDIVVPQPQSGGGKALTESLIDELTARTPEAVVAYRGKHRWTQTFEALRLDDSQKSSPRLRHGGVYLITGGLGGMGLVLAEHLARTVRAKLVLIARSPVPAREHWEPLTAHDQATQSKVRRLQALEALGAEVLIFSADVSDLAQMRSALKHTCDRFGTVHGVIHAAGVAGGELMQLKTRQSAARVLDPKVKGTLVLDELLKDTPLDFFLLCSSVNSLIGAVGQADYVAANAFLDAFARRNASRGGSFTVAINWDTWQEVGMAVTTAVPAQLEEQRAADLEHGILPGEGVQVFERILSHDFPQVIVSTQDFKLVLEQRYKTMPAPLLGESERGAMHSRAALGTAYVAPTNDVEQHVAEIWQMLLGIDRVGIHDNFFELGGHSLLATQVISRIRKKFSVQLTIRHLIDAPTVADTARAVAEELLSRIEDTQSVDALLSEVEGLSAEELRHQATNPSADGGLNR